ncbi:hypothetical protein CRYUN_Cryun01aG0223500 [Craigia yunnanensis]
MKSLKASKKNDGKGVILIVDDNSNSSIAKNSSKENRMQRSILPSNTLDLSGRSPKDSPCLMKENVHFGSLMLQIIVEKDVQNIVQESATSVSKAVSVVNGEAAACRQDSLVGFSGSRTCSSSNNSATLAAATNSMFNIKTEIPSSLPLSEQELLSTFSFLTLFGFLEHLNISREYLFLWGLLGPDGTKWHLGKWCKRGKMLGSTSTQGSTKISGDLIVVGADGRGG